MINMQLFCFESLSNKKNISLFVGWRKKGLMLKEKVVQ